jgi:hypothetical protein
MGSKPHITVQAIVSIDIKHKLEVLADADGESLSKYTAQVLYAHVARMEARANGRARGQVVGF